MTKYARQIENRRQRATDAINRKLATMMETARQEACRRFDADPSLMETRVMSPIGVSVDFNRETAYCA